MHKLLLIYFLKTQAQVAPSAVGIRGATWPLDICGGAYPAGEQIITAHDSLESCNLDVIQAPQNKPLIRNRIIEGKPKEIFYASSEQVHIAECYSDYDLFRQNYFIALEFKLNF